MEIGELSNYWQIIAKECRHLPSGTILANPGQSRHEIAELLKQRQRWVSGWDGYFGWWNWGIAVNYNFPLGDASLPSTTSLLRKIRGLKFASISLFRPGTILRCHSHPENKPENLFTFHLGIDVPSECWINIDGDFSQERNGQIIIFDGSKPHFAFNASNNDRLILHGEFRLDK